MPIEIAAMPIFIIGAEILLLYALLSIMRLDIKYSKFNFMYMLFTLFKNTVLSPIIIGFIFSGVSCANTTNKSSVLQNEIVKHKQIDSIKSLQNNTEDIIVGAKQVELYLPLIKGKRVGIVANQTSVVKKTIGEQQQSLHIVDYLRDDYNINIKKVFAPEHGFRGKADAGELVKDGTDTKTGLPIISLYGKNKKPKTNQLKGLDLIIFDIQDVGARFYTYISTLHYVMEACAEQGISLLIFDRPNPNGHYIDGPILEQQHKSFVGMHPVPIVHGLTIGEYAKMINGEGWLNNAIKCDITVIPVKNYTHNTPYSLPIKPSPNLPNDKAINLYPSLCLFEGTTVSVGRGTEIQFQTYGAPYFPKTEYYFKPKPNEGAKYPKYENKNCYGYDLTQNETLKELDLSFIINAYKVSKNQKEFFLKNGFFTKLSGTKLLQQQIESGYSQSKIKATWKSGLENYNQIRKKYLIYR